VQGLYRVNRAGCRRAGNVRVLEIFWMGQEFSDA
jgi:hypothetical protein